MVNIISGKQCTEDPEFSCPDLTTCCPLPKGEGEGCCPFPNATCCSDKTHCCPHGLTCDLRAGRCIGTDYDLLLARLGTGTKTMMSEERARSKVQPQPWSRGLGGDKVCPVPSFTCQAEQTCCPLGGGEWGCCPLGGDAVCCSDMQHCCPHDTVCDLDQGTCTPAP